MHPLNALQRLDAEEELMGLLVDCMLMGHEHRARMMQVKRPHAEAFSDEKLLALTDRLRTWVAGERERLAVEAAAAQDGALVASGAGS